MNLKLVLGCMILFAASGAWAGPAGSAQYLVPASEAGGTPDTYAAGTASINGVPGITRVLSFDLPEDLVGPGRENLILRERRSAPGFITFGNSKVSATCVKDAAHAICVMKYSPYYSNELDRAGIDSFLKAKYASDPAALESALARSKAFQRDPEGVLIF